MDTSPIPGPLRGRAAVLEVILGTVDAAIIVRDAHGRMVYANQASADLLKLESPEAVKTSPSSELMDRFDVYTEDGDPVNLEDLPGTRLLAGERDPAPLIVRNVVKATGEERWLLNKATGVTGADGRVSMAVNLIEDITESKRTEIGQRLLARTGRELAEASDLSRTLQAIADAAVPGLADWAGVDLVDARGRIKTIAVAHRDPEKVRLGWRLRTQWPVDPSDGEGLRAVIRTGAPQLVRDISDDLLVAAAVDEEHLAVLRAVGLTSTMVAPIRAGGRILGALSFVSSTSRRFEQRDLELACDLGRQAGVFINHAQLYAEQAHIARTLQASLIPQSLPRLENWTVSSAYRAAGRANEVGGDFYDLVPFDGGYAAIIGDVVGKGAEAAALTALARHTLVALMEASGDGTQALSVLNRRLRERRGEYGSLCTIGVILITDDDRATVLSAGHPLPLLARDGQVQLVGKTSPMLGFVQDVPISSTTIPIQPDDQLVLYTDGVMDAVGMQERFGERRLIDTIARLATAGRAVDANQIVGVIDRFLKGDQSDDIALMVLSRNAAMVPSGEPEAVA